MAATLKALVAVTLLCVIAACAQRGLADGSADQAPLLAGTVSGGMLD